jgi:glycosyltransferase involved in cell wall biosynthesis
VSVIVPVYNRRHLVTGTLESILAQTVDDFEIIVVDDGSTDGTAASVAALAARDSRIRYVFQENAGPGAARNRGIREARGCWVAFLDSDDLWVADKLANFKALIDDTPTLDFVHTNWERLYPDGTRSRPRDINNFEALSSKDYLLKHFCLKTSTVLIRRDLLDRIGGYFYTDFSLYEDYHLFWRAVIQAKAIGYIRSCDTTAIQSSRSLVRNITPETNAAAKIFAMDRLCRWLSERQLPPEHHVVFENRIYLEFRNLFGLLLRQHNLRGVMAEFRKCAGVLSLRRAVRALASSFLDRCRNALEGKHG